jgi:hypothetical protein
MTRLVHLIPNNQIVTLKRENGEVLTAWGRGGRMAGQFKWVHSIGISIPMATSTQRGRLRA